MDKFIRRFDAVPNDDLMLCLQRGVAYQRDMTVTAQYDESYYNKCASYEGKDIALKINAGRVALVNKWVGAETEVLDIGVGSGEFIKNRFHTKGCDVNPAAIAWLRAHGLYHDKLHEHAAYTFWDVIEHVEDPDFYFRRFPDNSFVFVSLPIFSDLADVRCSKHYRPGEHLYYFTEQGFIEWMHMYRFECLEVSDFETQAGRESIKSFAFKRTVPSYADTVGQYRDMHGRVYGSTAYLYFDDLVPHILNLDPSSILDFGCGHSDLVAHFWKDGARRIAKYDPGVDRYKEMPDGKFDLVICCDVMEHIPIQAVDEIFRQIEAKSRRVIFTISLRKARAKLPDGRNAHITLLTASEWQRWIASVFDRAVRCDSKYEHILVVRTW